MAQDYSKKPTQSIDEKRAYATKRAARIREEDAALKKSLGIRDTKYESQKQQKLRWNKKFQDEVIKNWKLTGMFIPPEVKYINKLIDSEIKEDNAETYEDFDDISIDDMFDININDMFDIENNEDDE